MLEPDAGIFGSRPGPDPGVGGCGWARQGWPQAVLITGEPGIGRTIVAAAVADGLRADGWQVAMAQAVPLTTGSPP